MAIRSVLIWGILILALAGPVFCGDPLRFVEWSEVSDKDLSPQARAALAQDKESWLHAETAHFIYQFRDRKTAETVYFHAEGQY